MATSAPSRARWHERPDPACCAWPGHWKYGQTTASLASQRLATARPNTPVADGLATAPSTPPHPRASAS